MKDFLGIAWKRMREPQFYWFLYAWVAGCCTGWLRSFHQILIVSITFIGGFLIGCLSRYLRTKADDAFEVARLLRETEHAD